MLDVAISYSRYKFIGYEFLTWLWFVMENQPQLLRQVDNELVSLDVGNRMVLENNRNEDIQSVTIKGDPAGLEEGLLALRKGAVVTELKLVYKAGNNEWRFGLKGESLNISSLTFSAPSVPSVSGVASFVIAMLLNATIVTLASKSRSSVAAVTLSRSTTRC